MAQFKKISDYHYLEKIQLVENVAAIGHGPRYIDHVGQPVGPDFPYTDGEVLFIGISRVSGQDFVHLYRRLGFEQLESIRQQLAYILE